METKQVSLFSLELVVEKLYLPHVTCRFPALAFRLLDFPTIVINHVEPDLADEIKKKISMDPYYQLPEQFNDLRDKNGNFIIKKGKSCLFKITPETLRMHLSNTPLYVMIIDTYPDTPKLLGNTAIALNSVMDCIRADIIKLGNTVPSVHGDKGLFKIYNLMGKEIGYVILGYRLLSLGPGLIAHLPESAIARRAADMEKQDFQTVDTDHRHAVIKVQPAPPLKNTKEMASMTDVQKEDVLMQTIETCDKEIHVAISGPEETAAELRERENRIFQTTSTQTDMKHKLKSTSNPKSNNLIQNVQKEEADTGVFFTNIVCPPPLFYNSEAEPPVAIQQVPYTYEDDSTSVEDDMTVQNISDEEEDLQAAVDKHGSHQPVRQNEIHQQTFGIQHTQPSVKYSRTGQQSNHDRPQQQIPLQYTPGVYQNLDPSQPIFPLLSALMNELSRLHGSGLQAPAEQQSPVTVVSLPTQQQLIPPKQKTELKVLSQQQVKVPVEQKNKENIPEDADDEKHLSQRDRRSHRRCAHPHEGVPKHKGWLRKFPEKGVNKTKLTFGLTNTQRLRLANTNPAWLKSVEKEEQEMKARKQKAQQKKNMEPDLDVGNLSDTVTEVRRLMEKGLDDTVDENTLLDAGLSAMNESSPGKQKTPPRKLKFVRSRENSPAWKSKQRNLRTRSRSPKTDKGEIQHTTDKRNVGSSEGDYEAYRRQTVPVSVEPETQNIIAPKVQEQSDDDQPDDEETPSSRSQKSIEVRIPSAQMQYDSDESEDSLPSDEPDKRETMKKSPINQRFPGFLRKNESLPESILGKPNQSLNASKSSDEDYQPLESTRYSKQYADESKLFRSTEDYDTKQFLSTDEPELQKLMSGDEKSEVEAFDRESMRRSEHSPRISASMPSSRRFPVMNPVASQQSPIPALRHSQVKLTAGSGRPSPTGTPRSRSSQGSQPTPRPRLMKSRERKKDYKRESIHTESVSSYVPSDTENANLSVGSDANYSDDFHPGGTDDSSVSVSKMSTPELPRLIPSAKLGYTIH